MATTLETISKHAEVHAQARSLLSERVTALTDAQTALKREHMPGIKRALAARAAETVVMASREKLNAASAFAIGELNLASTLIVDGEPDAALRQQLVQCGVEIIPVQR